MTDAPPPAPAVPDAVLGPLLECAGEVLRGLEAPAVPPAARRLRAFDRRGLATPAARAQLRRVLDGEDGFREAVAEKFLAQAEAASWLESWSADAAVTRVAEAADTGRLPLLASVLWAGRPPGFEFGLGLVAATHDAERDQAEGEERVRAAEARVAGAEEALRRAEHAWRAEAEAATRLEAEVKDQRRDRRAREQRAAGELEELRRQVIDLEAALAAARGTVDQVEVQLRQADERERTVRARLAEVEASPPPPSPPREPPVDWAGLARAAGEAERLAASLHALLEDGRPRPSTPPPAPPPPPARPATTLPRDGGRANRGRETRRARVHVPPGMMHDTPEAAAAMVRTPGAVVVIDGYNVSMLAWPDTPPAEQRDRLCDALAELHLRVRRPMVVVFDGAGIEGVPPLRRPGLSVVFSAREQEADEVVVDQVAARPPDVPVVVVSSDGWVRTRAEAEGAAVLPSAVFLDLLGR